MNFAGRNTVTRVVVSYQTCVTRKNTRSATIAQHRRYWYKEGNYQCPRKLFRLQLIVQMIEWRDNEEKLILIMDANENMETGQLSKLLSALVLGMRDVVKHRSQI